MELNYIVTKSDDSIKQILKNKFNMSERFILKLKKTNGIYINNVSVPLWFKIAENDSLKIIENSIEDSEGILPNPNIDLNILYEDDFLLIVDKPPFLPVHPSMSHYTDSLSNAVQYYFEKIDLQKKIRPVNRLDKDTSGIVIFAKNEYIQECLVKQMKYSLFKKEYIAFLDGILEKTSGTISAPISRKPDSIIERCIDFSNGSLAKTHYKLINTYNNISEVSFILETGRTHQIRLHSKYIGHPIIGDSLYGSTSNLISRQALHAYKVSFVHPITKNEIVIISDIPDDMKNLKNTSK